ncbi:MAG: DUF89 domain-containing protein [Promethearchaeota archaeon]
MRIHPRCFVCQVDRIYHEILLVTRDEAANDTWRLFRAALAFYGENLDAENSAALGTRARAWLAELSGCDDPYAGLKRKANVACLELVPRLREALAELPPRDRLEAAVKLSVLGNELEYFLAEHQVRLTSGDEFLGALDRFEFFINQFDEFVEVLEGANNVLFLTDNAGEVVFDALLLESTRVFRPPARLVVAVKDGPILNDATLEDAQVAGLSEFAEVITTSTRSVGFRLPDADERFRERWRSADLVVAKGMGHFESFDGHGDWFHCPLVHAFKVKCSAVAHELGVPLGSNVLKVLR